MSDPKNANTFPPHLTKAGHAFRSAILEHLQDDDGVHAETAVASAARMAGMFLFRSFNLKLGNVVQPGGAVLSEQANEAGPGLIQLLAGLTGGLGVEIDSAKLGEPTPKENTPHLTTLATQQKLEPAFEALRRTHHLPDKEAAQACAVATALLIRDTQQVLDPNIAFNIALFGFVEGTKTAPVPRSPAA